LVRHTRSVIRLRRRGAEHAHHASALSGSTASIVHSTFIEMLPKFAGLAGKSGLLTVLRPFSNYH
jgi:hypothetical protein